jgi:dTDP-4-amino-4,6-dideoxygalactose transaminase
VVSSDAALAARLKALRQYGWRSKYRSAIAAGRNSRLDEMQAAMLRVQLPFLEGWNRCRRAVAAFYCEALADAGLELPHDPSAANYVAHLFVIRSERRDEIRCRLEKAGIATDIHYPVPDYRQESVRGGLAGLSGDRPLRGRSADAACFRKYGGRKWRRSQIACRRSSAEAIQRAASAKSAAR